MVLLCGGLAYFAVAVTFDAVQAPLVTAYPTYFSGVGWTFVQNIMAWLPWLAIILASLLFAIVWSQKRGQGLTF